MRGLFCICLKQIQTPGGSVGRGVVTVGHKMDVIIVGHEDGHRSEGSGSIGRNPFSVLKFVYIRF